MKKIFSTIMMFFYSFAFAEVIPGDLACSKNGVDVIYINGIGYTESFVVNILYRQIQPRIPNNYLDSKKDEFNPEGTFVNFKYIYNHTGGYSATGFTLDFTESVAQELALQLDISVDEAFVLVYYYAYDKFLGNEFVSSVLGTLADTFSWTALENFISQEAIKEQLKNQLSQFASDNTNLKLEISRTLLSGKKLILVSESQGNLFVNTAIRDFQNGELLSFTDGGETKTGSYAEYTRVISNVQIATPTNSLVAKKTLSLNDEDIINLVFIDSPHSNIPFEDPEDDPRPIIDQYIDHFIWSTYLNYYNVGTGSLNELGSFTLQSLVDAAALLDSNCDNCKDNAEEEFEAAPHLNPDGSIGGLVSVKALVEDSVYIAPEAIVCGHATISGNVRILDKAFVDGFAAIQDDVVISGEAIVTGTAFLGMNAVVKDKGFVGGNAIVWNNGKVTENSAMYENSSLFNDAVLSGEAQLFSDARVYDSANISGKAVVSWSAEVGGAATVNGNAWLGDNAIVEGNAVVTDSAKCWENALVNGDAAVLESGMIAGNARLLEKAQISGSAIMYGDSSAWGEANIGHNATVYESAMVSGKAIILENASLTGTSHVFDNGKVWERGAVGGNARIYGNGGLAGDAQITNNFHIYQNGLMYGNARGLNSGRLAGGARASGNSVIFNSATVAGTATLSRNARVCGSAYVTAGNITDSTYCQ